MKIFLFSESLPAKTIFIIIVTILMTISSATLRASEIKVFKLKYASPGSVESVLKSLFGSQIKVASAETINAIVVNSDDKLLLKEIEKLVSVLDRRPVTFRFSIRSLSQSTDNSVSIGTVRPINSLRKQKIDSISHGEKTLTALEFAKASLTDETVRVFSLTENSEIPTVLTTTRGLKISARMADKNQIMVQLWYSEGEGYSSDVLLTEISTVAGEWISFGGIKNKSESNNNLFEVKAGSGGVSKKQTGGQIDRRFMIKIDIIN